jgi:hypothetical protein
MSVEDRLAIQEVIARYAHAYDDGDAASFADVFTDDGVFEIFASGRGAPVARLQSSAEIRDWAARRLAARRGRFTSRHHQSSILFEDLTPTSARTRTAVLVTHQGVSEAAPRVTTSGAYRDRWRKTSTGWRIAHRAAHVDGDPELAHEPVREPRQEPPPERGEEGGARVSESTRAGFDAASPPALRRTDKLMPPERVREMLDRGYAARVATVGPDGWPYAVPLLYVWRDGEIWLHTARARGHFRASVEREPRVCFEVDEPGEVFPYGRFECDTSVAYRSVIAFGRIRVIDDEAQRAAFFDALMAKYGDPAWSRPTGFYPRLGEVTVYAIAVDRMTGRETPLPAPANRWPAVDNTRTPHAAP